MYYKLKYSSNGLELRFFTYVIQAKLFQLTPKFICKKLKTWNF